MAIELQRPTEVKAWQSSVTDELRDHIISKIVQSIFPLPPSLLDHTDQRLQHLVNYARQIENDLFAMAETRSEYYHLIAEKIYKIMREMEEKRKTMQAQAPSQSPPQSPPSPPSSLSVTSDPQDEDTPSPSGNSQLADLIEELQNYKLQ